MSVPSPTNTQQVERPVNEEAVNAFLRGCIGYVTDDDEYRGRVREGLREAAPFLQEPTDDPS